MRRSIPLSSPLRCCPTFLSKEQARTTSFLDTKALISGGAALGSALGAPSLSLPLDTLSRLSLKLSGSALGAPLLPTPLEEFLEGISGAAGAPATAVGAAPVGTAAAASVGFAAAAFAAFAAALFAPGCRAVATSLTTAPLAVALAADAKAAAIVTAAAASVFMTAATALVVAAAASASRFVLATMAAFSARVALLDGAEDWLRFWAAARPWLFKTVTMPPC